MGPWRAGPTTASFAALPVVLAHVAVSLVVLSPRQGATVPPDSELVLLAQRTLGGVDRTTFTVQLDGHLLDPRTGRRATAGGATTRIAVGERATIPLRGLAPGAHQIEVDYRPDRDEPARATTVDFRVSADRPRALLLPVAVSASVLLAAAAGLLVRRRASGRRREATPS
jgi:hypothetical protein